MATSYRGRSSSRSKTPAGNYSAWGNYWGSSAKSSWGSNAPSKRTKTKKTYGATGSTSAYKTVCNAFQNKINSYRTLVEQTQGAGKFPRPTPTTLNTLGNWINKGAVVQTLSAAQLSRFARGTKFATNFNGRNCSTAMCKNILTAKFGKSCIKAVTRGKNGAFIVATASTHNGRAFNFPR